MCDFPTCRSQDSDDCIDCEHKEYSVRVEPPQKTEQCNHWGGENVSCVWGDGECNINPCIPIKCVEKN